MSYKKSLTDFYHIVIESSWVSIDNLKYNLEVLAWFSFFKMFSNIKSTNNTSTVLEFHLPFITTYDSGTWKPDNLPSVGIPVHMIHGMI